MNREQSEKQKLRFSQNNINRKNPRIIENTNGLIRQYLSKGKTYGKIKQSDVKLTEKKLNIRVNKVFEIINNK